MAKKKSQQNTDPKAQTLVRIKRTEAYAEQVRKLFAATVNEILALNKTMPTLKEGEMFSFDGERLNKQKEVERLLRQLHSVATMAIQRGIRLEWAQANAECDRLVQSMFGKKVMTAQYTAYMQRNETAMAAFIARSERGLNLSDRVWRSCRQLRDEMEVAITVAIGDGTSAATMSRQVRQYLNDPDLMFRRFQYHEKEPVLDDDGNPVLDKHGKPKMQDKLDKNGKPIIRKKWKKRVIDPQTGKVTFIDFDRDSYIPVGAQRDGIKGSTGVYKSAAKNAMRVARTETNIAYRRADNERWKQMDFVLGQRVQLSRSHPKKDICDKLAGDYPPDFVFDGWHPQCFCFVTPILVDEDEIIKMNEAMMNGEEYKPRGKRITEYPDGFKEWVRENEDKLLASHDAGKDPYFVRNNFADVQNILNPKKALTPLEIAEQRHAARTPEQEEAIRLRWQERQQQREAERIAEEQERKRIAQINTTANNVLGVAQTRFADFDIDTSALDIAMQSGDSNLIKAETRALAKLMSEKQKQIKQNAQSVIDAASLFKDFEGSTDVTSLEALKKTGNLSAIHAQSQALETQVNDLRAKLHAMSSVIPDPELWSDQFTAAELQATHDAIQSKLAGIASLPIDQQIKAIEKELKYVIDPNYLKPHKLYPTWKVAQSAYAEALMKAQHQQKVEQLTASLTSLKTYAAAHPKATALAALIATADAHLTANNLADAELAIFDAQKKQKQLEQAQARRDAKKGVSTGTTFTGKKEDYTQDRKDAAVWMKDRDDAVDQFFDNAVETWKLASDDERRACVRYTEGSGYITKFLRGIKGYHESDKSYAERALKDSELITAYIARSKSTYDCWIKRDERAAFTTYKFGIDVTVICDNERRKHDIQEQIKYNQKQLAASKSKSDKTYYQDMIDDYMKQLAAITTSPTQLLGKVGVDESFMSCGTSKDAWFSGTGGDNHFGRPRVCMNIYCPKGTMWTYADAFNYYTTGYSTSSRPWDGKRKNHAGENEIFMQRGTKMRVTKVEYDYAKDLLFIDVDVIEQRCPDMEVEYVPSEYGYKADFK